jgi:hypothetical protein
MTNIDPSQRLAAAVRAQLAARRERSAARAGGAQRTGGAQRGAYTVSKAMAQRIAAIAPECPERPRTAVRIYLEAELARAFGAGVLNDPEFPALLDAVQQRLQEDAHTAGAIEALGKLLLAGQVQVA